MLFFFSCPIYERFRAIEIDRPEDLRGDIYYDANCKTLENIGSLQSLFNHSNPPEVLNTPFLPIPFLFVDPSLSAADFERQYSSVMDKVAGLKWHPYAQKKTPKDYVDAGYIDFAADYNFPTVIHCERPNENGDLSALFRDVSPVAEKLRVPIDIALSLIHI